ncbi:MAG: hypothetical protein ACR2NO_10775 [Chloroflexota bacterium]
MPDIHSDLSRQDVLEAMELIRKEMLRGGMSQGRKSRPYCVEHPDTTWHFPPKYVISTAHKVSYGRRLKPSRFSGGAQSNELLFRTVACMHGGLASDPANATIATTRSVSSTGASRKSAGDTTSGAARPGAATKRVSDLVDTTYSAAGVNADPTRRHAMRGYAMQWASTHFAAEAWDVEDVSGAQPFDLRCRRVGDPELHVIVRAATTGEDGPIVLSQAEVTHALAHDNVGLFVVYGIKIGEVGGHTTQRRLQCWR